VTDAPPFPSRSTLQWVIENAAADEVVSVQPLVGGWTSAMHAVTVRRGSDEHTLVLRRMFREPWRTHARELLEREAMVLQMLAGHPVPTATLLAVDPTASATDEPALLMSQLPGRLRLDDLGVTAPLAQMLARIHRIRPDDGDRPRPYQSWAFPERRAVPAWAERPQLWQRAFGLIDVHPPDYEGCFLHRDFHPGNVLFDGGTITGVVDWVETSWGPADLDVAHCSTALSLLHGTDAAKHFRDDYRAAGGALGGDRYWSLIDAVGFLPDPEKVAAPWRQSGRPDLAAQLARRRLEAQLSWVLDGPLD
jgi:aminoglycoside phosphotransferase (APT) family kinase protein